MSDNNQLPFKKENYILMLIGLAILVVGLVLMSLDGEEFGFGFMGLTLGPIIVTIGFAFQFYAILKKSKSDK